MTEEALQRYFDAEKALYDAMGHDPECAEEFIGMLRNRAADRMVEQAKQRAWRLKAMPGDSRSFV